MKASCANPPPNQTLPLLYFSPMILMQLLELQYQTTLTSLKQHLISITQRLEVKKQSSISDFTSRQLLNHIRLFKDKNEFPAISQVNTLVESYCNLSQLKETLDHRIYIYFQKCCILRQHNSFSIYSFHLGLKVDGENFL